MQPPNIHLLNPRFRYTPAAATNIVKTWMRFGWTPPDREKQREQMVRLNPMESKECNPS